MLISHFGINKKSWVFRYLKTIFLFNLKLPDATLTLVSQRLKTHDYPLLIKRLDQSSITINLRTGSKEVDDLLRILQVILQFLIKKKWIWVYTENLSPNKYEL